MNSVKNYKDFYSKTKKNKKKNYPESLVVKYLQDFKFGKNSRSLDFSCGRGRHLNLLNNITTSVYGSEVSDEQVKMLKKNYKNYFFKVSDNTNLSFKNNFFDLILAFNSIYYVKNKNVKFETILKNFSKILKKNGLFFFTMLGYNHSLLDKKFKNKNFQLINNDQYNFRNGLLIYSSKNLKKKILENFKIISSGTILEKHKNFNRHLVFYLCQKN